MFISAARWTEGPVEKSDNFVRAEWTKQNLPKVFLTRTFSYFQKDIINVIKTKHKLCLKDYILFQRLINDQDNKTYTFQKMSVHIDILMRIILHRNQLHLSWY